jgi:hypothetical protein
VIIREPLLRHLAGAQIDGVQPGGAVVLLEIHFEDIPGLPTGVGNEPPLPDVDAASGLAERLAHERRSLFQRLLEVRLLDDAPGLGGGNVVARGQQKGGEGCESVGSHDSHALHRGGRKGAQFPPA